MKSKVLSRKALLLSAMGAVFAAAIPAQAAMMLTLSTTGVAGTVVILDNNVPSGDVHPSVGVISNSSFLYGDFNFTITIATSNSPGAPSGAVLQITSIDVRNTGIGRRNLDISLSDNNFTSPVGPSYDLASSVAGTITGGTAGDVVTFRSYADPSNVLNGHAVSTPLQTATLAASSVFPVSLSTPDRNTLFTSSLPFSVSNSLSIDLSAGAQANVSGTTTISAVGATVPEPASLGVLSVGAVGLLARRRAASRR